MSTRKPTKADCHGCRDDFYNGRVNIGGGTECWSFKTARLILRKEVHINDVPPWDEPRHKPKLRPACYGRSQYVFVNVEKTR